MAKRLVVHIPHRLGIDEVRRRLDGRAEWAEQRLRREGVRLTIDDWEENERSFQAAALGQHVTGFVAVAANSICFEIQIPWILGAFTPKIEVAAKHYASRLLEPCLEGLEQSRA
jgi:hypothetical protein